VDCFFFSFVFSNFLKNIRVWGVCFNAKSWHSITPTPYGDILKTESFALVGFVTQQLMQID